MTASEYLEDSLRLHGSPKEEEDDAGEEEEGEGEGFAEKDRIRTALKAVFPRRECHTLVR